jgi:HEAT repeat protein
MACLDILKEHGDKTIIDSILNLLGDEENDVVIFRAIDLLAKYGDPSLLDKIVPFENYESDPIRCSVVDAYGKLQNENSQTRIVPFLHDQSYSVRASAVSALIELGDPKNLKLILQDMDIWQISDDPYSKTLYNMACLEAIGAFGNENHFTILRDVVLKHPDADCRAAAILALRLLKNKKMLDILFYKLSDEAFAYMYDDKVCNIAARILNTVDDEKSRKALDQWLVNLPEDKMPELFSEPSSFYVKDSKKQ